MAHILKRKINNVIYVYQEKSYRDKLGRPRTKQKCLGKLDSNGVLILSRKRNPKNLPASITKYKIITTKFRVKAITDTHKENKQVKPQSLINSHKPAPLTIPQKPAKPRPVSPVCNKFSLISMIYSCKIMIKFLANLVNAKDSLIKHRDYKQQVRNL